MAVFVQLTGRVAQHDKILQINFTLLEWESEINTIKGTVAEAVVFCSVEVFYLEDPFSESYSFGMRRVTTVFGCLNSLIEMYGL